MRKFKIYVIILITFALCSFNSNKMIKEDESFVPNEETAIKVAEAVWLPIFGNEIYDNRPFVAKLLNSRIWLVQGTTVKTQFGGVPYIEIQKSDCKVLRVYHDK
jgi:hypothetical protein